MLADRPYPVETTRAATIDQIRATLKPVDAWWTVLVIDPIAVRLIWLLTRARLVITAEGLTWVSLVFGLACGGAFAEGHYVVGAVSYEISFLFDCLDGKWSRLTGMSSERGAFLDGLVGTVVLAAAVGGLGFHEALQPHPGLAVFGAVFLLTVRALSNYLTIYLQADDAAVHTVFRTADAGWLARHRLLAPLAFPDRHVLLFVVAPLVGVVGPTFVAVGALELVMQARKGQLVWRKLTRGLSRESGAA